MGEGRRTGVFREGRQGEARWKTVGFQGVLVRQHGYNAHMKINYNVTVSDLVAFNIHVMKKSRWMVFAATFLSIMFVFHLMTAGIAIAIINLSILILGLVSVPFAISNPPKAATVVFGGIGVLFGLFYFTGSTLPETLIMLPALLPIVILCLVGIGFRKSLEFYYSGKTDMTGPHTLELNDQGLFETTAFSNTSYKWEAVTNIETDKQNIYVFLGKLKAYVIPRSSIDSAIQQSLLEELNRTRGTAL